MKRTKNVRPILGQGKSSKMVNVCLKGKNIQTILERNHKEEKAIYETKEEKFLGSMITIKNLEMVISGYTDDELLEVIKKDKRVNAVRIATKELNKRNG